jgi:hypothetical protein
MIEESFSKEKIGDFINIWNKYKYIFIALGFITLSIALLYWFNKSNYSSDGDTDISKVIKELDSSSSLELSTFDIPSITYEDRSVIRRSVRDSFFDNDGRDGIRFRSLLQERNEELALESLNLKNSLSREELIKNIYDSDISPISANDAIHALLRQSVRENSLEQKSIITNTNPEQICTNYLNNYNPFSESCLYNMVTNPSYGTIPTTFNSISDLIIYNEENIPLPNPYLIDITRYNHFIQFLDLEDAIVAAYYLSIPPFI